MENLKNKFVKSVQSYLRMWAYEEASLSNLNCIAAEVQNIGLETFDPKIGKIVVPSAEVDADNALRVYTEFRNSIGAIEFSFVFTLKASVEGKIYRN